MLDSCWLLVDWNKKVFSLFEKDFFGTANEYVSHDVAEGDDNDQIMEDNTRHKQKHGNDTENFVIHEQDVHENNGGKEATDDDEKSLKEVENSIKFQQQYLKSLKMIHLTWRQFPLQLAMHHKGITICLSCNWISVSLRQISRDGTESVLLIAADAENWLIENQSVRQILKTFS